MGVGGDLLGLGIAGLATVAVVHELNKPKRQRTRVVYRTKKKAVKSKRIVKTQKRQRRKQQDFWAF